MIGSGSAPSCSDARARNATRSPSGVLMVSQDSRIGSASASVNGWLSVGTSADLSARVRASVSVNPTGAIHRRLLASAMRNNWAPVVPFNCRIGRVDCRPMVAASMRKMGSSSSDT